VGSLIQRFRRDPGLVYLALALVAAVALYVPAVGRGLVNYDDPWLYKDNAVLHDPSWASVVTVFTDLDSPQRFELSPEYLPIRDLSVMTDYAVWGEHYGGFHLTSLAIYLAAIAIWFAALTELGIARPIAGLALLVWAVQPSHAESVAWLAERKGMLGMFWAGTCALGYARFRAGRSAWWLVLAVTGGVFAVWSKAIAAFAVAALGPLELALPERRVSWRRSLTGLGAIAVCTGLAYVPVVVLALRWSIVGGDSAPLPASRLVSVIGVHGFYLRLAAGTIANAVSYPIAIAGPSALDVVTGALGFAAVIAALVRGSPVVRAAAIIWLFGWLPVGHLLMPLQMVFVADRYLLVPSLGFALAIAAGLAWIPRPRLRLFASAVVVLAFALRALDAQASWSSNELLWQRAIASNPSDGNAWAMYLEALDEEGRVADAARVVDEALGHSRLPRLVLHAALTALAEGRTDEGVALMTEAATHGEPRAMANLANLYADRGRVAEALRWARYATVAAPSYANGHRVRGKAARLAHHPDESLRAFEHAYLLEPTSAPNRYNLALAYADANRSADARRLLVSCLDDPEVGRAARDVLAKLPD
jgi:tetratricopeptide (TPR) repeat protein